MSNESPQPFGAALYGVSIETIRVTGNSVAEVVAKLQAEAKNLLDPGLEVSPPDSSDIGA